LQLVWRHGMLLIWVHLDIPVQYIVQWNIFETF
jgi:hypothetical protein